MLTAAKIWGFGWGSALAGGIPKEKGPAASLQRGLKLLG